MTPSARETEAWGRGVVCRGSNRGERINMLNPAVTSTFVPPPPLCLVLGGGDGDVTGVECQPRAGRQAKQPGQVCASSVPEKEGHQKKGVWRKDGSGKGGTLLDGGGEDQNKTPLQQEPEREGPGWHWGGMPPHSPLLCFSQSL